MQTSPPEAKTRSMFGFTRFRFYGLLAFLYALLMTFGGCADKLLLHPQTGPSPSYGATRRVIPHGGGTLDIWTARNQPARPPAVYLLEFTGNATRAEDITTFVASRWGDRSVEAWVPNYPGYGGSTGRAKLGSIPAAALVAYDALKKVAGDAPIVIAGNSLGTTAALYVAANRPCAGMILQSPAPLRNLILGKFGWWNLWLVAGPVALGVPSDLGAMENARRVTAPALFITGGADTLIPPEYQQKVIDAYAGPKRHIVLKGKGHNDTLDTREELRSFEEALGWLMNSRLVPQGQPGSRTPDAGKSVE